MVSYDDYTVSMRTGRHHHVEGLALARLFVSGLSAGKHLMDG
jgi:hypothetical protein